MKYLELRENEKKKITDYQGLEIEENGVIT